MLQVDQEKVRIEIAFYTARHPWEGMFGLMTNELHLGDKNIGKNVSM